MRQWAVKREHQISYLRQWAVKQKHILWVALPCLLLLIDNIAVAVAVTAIITAAGNIAIATLATKLDLADNPIAHYYFFVVGN